MSLEDRYCASVVRHGIKYVLDGRMEGLTDCIRCGDAFPLSLPPVG